MGFDEFLNQLPEDDDATINYASLLELSGLTGPEADEFGQLWLEWTSERVGDIVDRMVGLSNEQPDVEFETIFKQGLLHPSANVRVSALKGLEESDDRTLIKPLCEMLKTDPMVEVRAAAAIPLAYLSAMAQTGKLGLRYREALIGVLYGVLEDVREVQDVKLKALEAVSVFSGDRLAPFIEEAWSSGDCEAKQSSLFAMGRTSDPRWVEHVLTDLEHGSVAVRYEATMAMGELCDEEHLRALESSLDDEDLTVQLAAISAVERIGGEVAQNLLELKLVSPEPRVVELVQRALQTMKNEEDLDEVVTQEMARSMFGAGDTLPGIDTEGYEPAEIEGWANLPDPSEVDDFGTGVTEEAEELGLDRGDPFDIDLPPEDPWDHEENF
ncbi:MAG: HEAT repeat domain-containing protein [Dehalococcoidia bacterium]|jgi:HEAT repeat protein|nr:HEAT repeat domain-containing protein [Dehalococcoidia bacterium]MDP7486249.1 HEAT repeat domain-containing protein [Dehalococcoidia bacterium]|tara:strand:+ start:1764 stop:2915 length:1152 start_codon:yes stop_codon:yes gene_type:complete